MLRTAVAVSTLVLAAALAAASAAAAGAGMSAKRDSISELARRVRDSKCNARNPSHRCSLYQDDVSNDGLSYYLYSLDALKESGA